MLLRRVLPLALHVAIVNHVTICMACRIPVGTSSVSFSVCQRGALGPAATGFQCSSRPSPLASAQCLLPGARRKLSVIPVCISLVAGDLGHLIVSLSTICVSSGMLLCLCAYSDWIICSFGVLDLF